MIENIKDLNKSNVLLLSLFFIGVLAPGALTIFIFDRELFSGLDTAKLLLLSVGVSAPGIFLPYMISLISATVIKAVNPNLDGDTGSEVEWFGIHCLNNSINYYLSLWLSYVFGWPFHTFLYVITALVLGFSALEMYRIIKRAKNIGVAAPIFNEQ